MPGEREFFQQLKGSLSSASSGQQKQAVALQYAHWFYQHYNSGLDNQFICLRRLMDLTGLDDRTCAQVQ